MRLHVGLDWRTRSVVAVMALATASTVFAQDIILNEEPPPPPDRSFLDQPFHACKVPAKARSLLTAAEKCWVAKLSARCTPADDCLVACLASTTARDSGGGCWHACFQVKFNMKLWKEPAGAESCRTLGKVSGI